MMPVFFAVSLLSGHLGGANHLARDVADRIGAVPVITTATDVNGLPSIDMIAKEKDLYIQTPENIKHVNMAILKQTAVSLYDPLHRLGDELSGHLRVVETDADANVACTYEIESVSRETLILRPRVLALGIGCNRNTPGKEILAFVENTLKENNVSIHSACRIGTSDVKLNEAGLLQTAAKMEIPIDFFSREELNSVEGVKNPSMMARKHLGVNSVCEAAAILASGGGEINHHKKKEQGCHACRGFNAMKLYVIGTGPGNEAYMSKRAVQLIEEADYVAGYTTYLDLISDLIQNKKTISTGMMKEVDRVEKAIETALDGKTCALVSGGDPGIYAMAGLVFEICEKRSISLYRNDGTPPAEGGENSLCLEIVPGIPALAAGAALAGAPLTHDFAAVSLSDLLTPWETIEKRLSCAALADFVIVLYNPKSKKRDWQLARAGALVMEHRSGDTPVAVVTGAMRENQKVTFTTLEKMADADVGMQTVLFIGSMNSRRYMDFLFTPRGYSKKYEI